MEFAISPAYALITEKPFCCLPAVLQMIQIRRGLPAASQEDIGWQLGLIVPEAAVEHFARVRTGPEPTAGYGTQTAKEEFSLTRYFERNELPLSWRLEAPQTLDALRDVLELSLASGDDIVLCYDSAALFGDGDREHVSLVQSWNSDCGELLLVDPAIGAPKLRPAALEKLFQVVVSHKTSARGGLWIVSSRGGWRKKQQQAE